MPSNVQLQDAGQAAPNNEWQDLQWNFNGAWMPDEDPALIGPENFATLQNLRYNMTAIEGVSGYMKYNPTALATYVNIKNGIQLRGNANLPYPSQMLVHAADAGGQGRVFRNRTQPDTTGEFITAVAGTLDGAFDVNGNYYYADSEVGLTGRFSEAPQGSVAYCNTKESLIYPGEEQRISAAFVTNTYVETSATLIQERTEQASIATNTTKVTIDAVNELLICTTSPIQGIKFYIANANAVASTLTVKYWDGSAFQNVTNKVDNTASGGASLAQTGKVMFDHTSGVVKTRHYQELYLYQYLVELTAGTANAYYITVDMGMAPIVDVWDGVYRQPIQFQVLDTVWADYTLYVNEPSTDLSSPIGAELGTVGAAGFPGVVTTDHIEFMFDDKISAIKVVVVPGKTNTNGVTMSMHYWDGDSWAALTIIDGTDATPTPAASKTLTKTGLITFTPPTDIEKATKFGTTGYLYAISFSGALSGAAADDIVIDLVTGIPAQLTVQPFAWSAIFNNRLMLGNFQEGAQANRMDFCVAQAPSVWNGFESSIDGAQSLYFGNDEPITGGVQLYNRFGASVFSMFMVFKANDIYMVVGESPEDFIIYPVSSVVGCPAPLSIATAELGMAEGETSARNIALWLSNSGPMMFDGASIIRIPGIDTYFEQGTTATINWDYFYNARGWYDQTFKEYNITLPSSSSTINDLWFVFDLKQKKWFQKSTGTADSIQSAWNCIATTGEPYVFGGANIGRVYKLEQGTTWDGVGITQILKTGDFWPTKNIWDETLIRKFKLICKKIADSSDNTISIYYYNNTATNAGAGVIFEDESASEGIYVSFEDTVDVEWAEVLTNAFDLSLDIGLQRLTRVIQDLNYKGWAHAFEFTITTTTVPKGWEPIFWGIQFRVERKDNTAT